MQLSSNLLSEGKKKTKGEKNMPDPVYPGPSNPEGFSYSFSKWPYSYIIALTVCILVPFGVYFLLNAVTYGDQKISGGLGLLTFILVAFSSFVLAVRHEEKKKKIKRSE